MAYGDGQSEREYDHHPHQSGINTGGHEESPSMGSLHIGAIIPQKRIQEKNIILDVIEVLNLWGYNIVWIAGEYYQVTEFLPADMRSTHVHLMSGRRITDLLMSHSNRVGVSEVLKSSIQDQMAGLHEVRREYHSSTPWIKFDVAYPSNRAYNPAPSQVH